MKAAIVTYLATEDYIPGVLALANSISIHVPGSEFIILIAENAASLKCKKIFQQRDIKFRVVSEVVNPYILPKEIDRYKHTYTKFRVFEMYDYEKVIYLDADMIVCNDISDLFNKPHLSAVNAGGLKIQEWVDLNSGLMVIEPNESLFEDILKHIPLICSKDGGDQGFFQSYFKNWSTTPRLRLDHGYNVPFGMLQTYVEEFGFRFKYKNGVLNTNISIVHFWGIPKPWHTRPGIEDSDDPTDVQVLRLWWDMLLSPGSSLLS